MNIIVSIIYFIYFYIICKRKFEIENIRLVFELKLSDIVIDIQMYNLVIYFMLYKVSLYKEDCIYIKLEYVVLLYFWKRKTVYQILIVFLLNILETCSRHL